MNNLSYDRSPIENTNSVYSVGTAIAINALEKEYHLHRSNMVLVSVNTLVRNIINKDSTFSSVLSHFNTELSVLMNEITNIIGRTISPVVVLYAADYSKLLNESMIRPMVGNRKLIYEVIEYIIKKRKELFGDKCDGVINNVRIVFRCINYSHTGLLSGAASAFHSTSMIPPYTRLLDNIKDLASPRNVIMMSHNPIDYHICRYVDSFVLLESHTGEWKKPHQLGQKVFGNDCIDVPFYPATHYCLGDKHLVLPTLNSKLKTMLLEEAKRDNWNTKSQAYVKSKIVDMFKLDIKNMF